MIQVPKLALGPEFDIAASEYTYKGFRRKSILVFIEAVVEPRLQLNTRIS